MKVSASFLLAALAEVALAVPNYNYAPYSYHPSGHVSQPPYSTGGGGGPGGPGGPYPPITKTDTITKTTFVPCSTAIVSDNGHTYYSTWLTTSLWTTTTCYEVTPTPSPQNPPHPGDPGYHGGPGPCEGSHCNPVCPPQATVTVTVTQCGGYGCGGPHGPGGQPEPTYNPDEPNVPYVPGKPPHYCPHCQTITYTDVDGGTNTVVIPPKTSTVHTPTGTGVQPSHTNTPHVPTGTGYYVNL